MIYIKNMRKEKPLNPWDVIVCHPSVFGNPSVGKGGVVESERDKVCDEYDMWFDKNIQKLKPHLDLLYTKWKEYGILNLFCWCAPKRCHAETIKRYLEHNYKETI